MVQNRRNRRRFLLLWLCFWIFFLFPGAKRCAAAQTGDGTQEGLSAQSEGFVLVGQDPTEGYRYAWGENGGFYSNLLPNATEEFAYFSFDEGISWKLFRDGGLLYYKNMDLLTEAGQYVFYLTGERTGESTVFAFVLTGLKIEDLFPTQAVPGGNGSSGGQATTDWMQGLENVDLKECGLRLFYDAEQKCLLYRDDVEYRDILRSDVPNDAVTGETVYLAPANGVVATIYRDGKLVETAADGRYGEPGYYQCNFTLFPERTEETAQGTEAEDGEKPENASIIGTVFRFRIMDKQSTGVHVMTPPDGFFLERVSYNGADVPFSETGVFFLNKDGSYEFCFQASEYNFIKYRVTVFRDTTAPFLTFDKEVGKNIVKPPVTFFCTEEGCTYEIRRNGYPYNYLPGEALFLEGYYLVFVSDMRGNTREYEVRIMPAYRFFSKGMLLLLAGVVLCVGILMIRVRNDLRVR